MGEEIISHVSIAIQYLPIPIASIIGSGFFPIRRIRTKTGCPMKEIQKGGDAAGRKDTKTV
jgi:hypothetical protein